MYNKDIIEYNKTIIFSVYINVIFPPQGVCRAVQPRRPRLRPRRPETKWRSASCQHSTVAGMRFCMGHVTASAIAYDCLSLVVIDIRLY